MITRFLRCAQPVFVVAFILFLGVTACVQAQATKPPVPGIKWSTLSNNPKPTISGSSPSQAGISTPASSNAPAGQSNSAGTQPNVTTPQPKGTSTATSASTTQSAPASVSLAGRRVCTPLECLVQPYCSIGMITNAKQRDCWGTGTLIGSQYVLTAAHVIESADATEQGGGGDAVFVLPALGTESRIVRAELDGGWKHKIISFDIAICMLEKPVSTTLKHVQWGVFDDSLFDANVNLTGYDADVSLQGGKYPLVTRSGAVTTMTKHATEFATKGAAAGWGFGSLLDGGVVFSPVDSDSLKGYSLGSFRARGFSRANSIILGFAAGASAGFAGHQLDREGWVSHVYVAAGANGAPIWIQRNNEPVVVGVQSLPPDLLQPSSRAAEVLLDARQLKLAWGSRITAGPCESMIQNFTATPSGGSH